MANISVFSINNCFANVADNNVHENIVAAENLTEEEVAAKIDETMQDVSADNEAAKEDKEIVINNDKKNKVDKVQDPEAIAKMNTWKEQRPTEETIKNNNSAYTDMTVVSVDVVGNEKIAKEDILNVLTVKAGDKFNIKNIEQDRNNIYNTGYFYDNYPSYEVVPEGVKITYHVMENPVLNSVEILGNQVYSTDKIEDMLTVKKGEILNIRQLNTDLANIEASYRQDGYILAKLRDISIDESGNLTLTFNEGILEGYVVKGNDKTKDYVITREMRIKPGEVFDAKKARRSMQRVYNLGFFEDVSVKILPGKEDPNNIIMELTVIEKRTGSFGIGAGYSSEDGLLGMVSIGDTNFRGTGDSVKAMYEFGGDGGDDSGYSISYTKPWLDEKETTGTFRIYDRKFEYDDYDNSGDLIETYDKKNQGYELNFGRPTDEYTMNYLGFKINDTEYRGLLLPATFGFWVMVMILYLFCTRNGCNFLNWWQKLFFGKHKKEIVVRAMTRHTSIVAFMEVITMLWTCYLVLMFCYDERFFGDHHPVTLLVGMLGLIGSIFMFAKLLRHASWDMSLRFGFATVIIFWIAVEVFDRIHLFPGLWENPGGYKQELFLIAASIIFTGCCLVYNNLFVLKNK